MLTIDATDPDALATWWAEVLGWVRTYEDGDEITIEAPEYDAATRGDHSAPPVHGVGAILFLRTPDAKAAKNRLHLDLRPDDQDAEVARVESMGAVRADIGQGDVSWVVLRDPEGNEFCILSSRALPDA